MQELHSSVFVNVGKSNTYLVPTSIKFTNTTQTTIFAARQCSVAYYSTTAFQVQYNGTVRQSIISHILYMLTSQLGTIKFN